MNWAHVHLLLNHVPVLGPIFGLALMVWAMLRRNDGVQRVALGTLVVVAVLALPVYFTGEPAEGVVEGVATVSERAIEAHEEAALVSLISVELLGIIALAGLYTSRSGRPLSAMVTRAAVLIAVVAAGLMARTANLGGQIRHTEIRADTGPPATERGVEEEGR